MNTGIIYMATSPSGNSYIGQTEDIKRRKSQHKHTALNDAQQHFSTAIRKYGWDNITWNILEHCPISDLSNREVFWIATFDTFHNGYNMTPGGEESPMKIPELAKKAGDVQKGKNLSDEHRQKISETLKGRTFSDEHRQKISDTKKGKTSPHKGKTLSVETRQKMSETRKGVKKSPETRQKISESSKGRIPWNKGKRKVRKPSPLQLNLFD